MRKHAAVHPTEYAKNPHSDSSQFILGNYHREL